MACHERIVLARVGGSPKISDSRGFAPVTEMRANVRNLDRVRLHHLARHDGSVFTGRAGNHKRIGYLPAA